MYSYTDLRKWVILHGASFNDGDSFVSFKKQPELVVTRNVDTNIFKNTKLRSPVSASGIKMFLEENQKWFFQPDGADIMFDKKGNNTKPISMMKRLSNLAGYDAEIVEFDDFNVATSYFSFKSELVYGIIINR